MSTVRSLARVRFMKFLMPDSASTSDDRHIDVCISSISRVLYRKDSEAALGPSCSVRDGTCMKVDVRTSIVCNTITLA